MVCFTVYNSARLSGMSKAEFKPLEDFIPEWWTDEEKSSPAVDLAAKAAAAFGAFGGTGGS